jgi:hypothetical protein
MVDAQPKQKQSAEERRLRDSIDHSRDPGIDQEHHGKHWICQSFSYPQVDTTNHTYCYNLEAEATTATSTSVRWTSRGSRICEGCKRTNTAKKLLSDSNDTKRDLP